MIVHPCNNLCSSIGPFRVSRAGFGPLFALELKQGDILTALYAPLRLLHYENGVNAGEKMHQRAGVKLHHVGMPNAPTGRLLRRDKQNEKRIA